MFYVWDPLGKSQPLNWESIDPVASVEAVTQKKRTPEEEAPHKITNGDVKHAPQDISMREIYDRLRKRRYEHRQAITAAQIMTLRVKTLFPDDTLFDAGELITTNRFRHVPVISREGNLVGILSDRDLLRHTVVLEDRTSRQESRVEKVGDIMSTQIISARPNAEIRQAAHLMLKERIGCIPIVDREGNLVGILTRSDILRSLVHSPSIDLWI